MLIGQSKFYKSSGFWWTVNQYVNYVTREHVNGPYCLNCQGDIVFPDSSYEENPETGYPEYNVNWTGKVSCNNCGKTFDMKLPLYELENLVITQYVIMKRSEVPKQALDEPPTQVKVRDEDDKYFLAVKIGEKDGKRVGVAYFGEKTKEQSKKDYSQIFIDLDNDQVRFDKTNKPPKEVIAKMVVEFPDSSHEEIYNPRARTGEAKKPSASSKRRAGDN